MTGRRSNQLSYAPADALRKHSHPDAHGRLRIRPGATATMPDHCGKLSRLVSLHPEEKGAVTLPSLRPEGFVRRRAVPLSLALFARSSPSRGSSSRPGRRLAHLLFTLPIALMAIAEGAGAGLAAAGLAIVLTAAWALTNDVDISAVDYITRAVAFGTTGGVVGWFADRSRPT